MMSPRSWSIIILAETRSFLNSGAEMQPARLEMLVRNHLLGPLSVSISSHRLQNTPRLQFPMQSKPSMLLGSASSHPAQVIHLQSPQLKLPKAHYLVSVLFLPSRVPEEWPSCTCFLSRAVGQGQCWTSSSSTILVLNMTDASWCVRSRTGTETQCQIRGCGRIVGARSRLALPRKTLPRSKALMAPAFFSST